jgi:hypothetical protein
VKQLVANDDSLQKSKKSKPTRKSNPTKEIAMSTLQLISVPSSQQLALEIEEIDDDEDEATKQAEIEAGEKEDIIHKSTNAKNIATCMNEIKLNLD